MVEFASVARMAIVTAQDLLKLGTKARMNTPRHIRWQLAWRCQYGALGEDISRWLGELTETFGRALPEEEK